MAALTPPAHHEPAGTQTATLCFVRFATEKAAPEIFPLLDRNAESIVFNRQFICAVDMFDSRCDLNVGAAVHDRVLHQIADHRGE